MTAKSPKDFWAGLMFVAFGLIFTFGALNYRVGTAARMGPGYFPALLGGLMTVIGAVLFFRSLAVKGGKFSPIPFRVLLLISAGLVAFGYLVVPIGFVLALAALVLISAAAGHEFSLKETLLLSAVLIVLSVAVFVKGLALPFPLWPRLPG
ncbi:MAG TPA: tripartite tricarboxylate transporter TctB family protein [Thermodesulfobacteriota bacterium]|nr:tripartite tricarboxylate transporter TctB family protein [Thermodesulfobacteriota bacterium]